MARGIGVTVVLGALLAACRAAPSERIALTSFYPMYVHTINVTAGVPGVKVVNLTRPVTGCLHDYQLTPDNLATITRASWFIVNGGGMESFFEKALRQAPGLAIVDASKGIPLIRTGGVANPHVWVSVSGAISQVANIAEGLSAADPANAAQYRTNAAAYVRRLDSLRVEMHRQLDPFRGSPIITFHEAFPYFSREFGLTIVAVVEREPGSEPGAAELARTIRTVRSAKVKALFAEPQYPAKSAQVIARETGVGVHVLDPAVTGPDSPDAYLTIMRRNLAVLEQALK